MLVLIQQIGFGQASLIWTPHKDVKLYTQPAVSLLDFHLLTFTRDDQKCMGAKQKILPYAVNNVSFPSIWILTTLETSDNQMHINQTRKMLMVKYDHYVQPKNKIGTWYSLFSMTTWIALVQKNSLPCN